MASIRQSISHINLISEISYSSVCYQQLNWNNFRAKKKNRNDKMNKIFDNSLVEDRSVIFCLCALPLYWQLKIIKICYDYFLLMMTKVYKQFIIEIIDVPDYKDDSSDNIFRYSKIYIGNESTYNITSTCYQSLS